DLAGGRFLVSELADEDALAAELARLEPAELLVPDEDGWPAWLNALSGSRRRAPWHFDQDAGHRRLLRHFGTRDLDAFGIEDRTLAIAAAGALLGYLEETQKQQLPHLASISLEAPDEAIAINAASRRHLELDTRIDGERRHTLLGVLDSTVSPMGGRLLRRWLHRPLRDRDTLARRHQAVASLIESDVLGTVRERFRALGDLERILARVALRSARPRDLSTLRDGLAELPAIRSLLQPADGAASPVRPESAGRTALNSSPLLDSLREALGEHADSADLLARAIAPQPALKLSDGGVIADGFDAELDQLRALSTQADGFLSDMEAREREATGIATLKLGYNRVHGYYIEISKGQS
ncbi:MAG: DNA mismatch repair protein MutS, partial [Gammaproteobacteria bacterium HGW-Gammaproteobacteria-7]